MAYSAEDQKRVNKREREMAAGFNDNRPKVVAPTVAKTPDSPLSDSIETHPAFGQISAHRVSGSTYLYGSDFDHQHFIAISVKASELHRGLSRDWAFARREYVEVWLSEAQWATFVSSLNVGMGVQCTVKAVDQVPVPGLPRPAPKTDLFKEELKENFREAREALDALKERLKAGKGGKESLALVDRAIAQIGSSAVFVAKQFSEHMEDVEEAAKTEVNAYIQSTLLRLGLDAAKAPIALERGPDTAAGQLGENTAPGEPAGLNGGD